ncbi:MAG: phosphate ABC transporter substrate-binding protein [Candidatus Bathyarchaeia archaeon]
MSLRYITEMAIAALKAMTGMEKFKVVLVILLVSTLTVAGAYYILNPANPPAPPATQTITRMGGRIIQRGSDTLLILAQRWAEEFMNRPDHEGVLISVSGGGSGTGIASLINGETDLADSSREIKPKELEHARSRGVNPCEWKVALDGIVIIINPENPLTELTLSQLDMIYRGEALDWASVGGSGGKIITYGRQSNSGTYQFFQEHVLKSRDYRNDVQAMNGNADIVEAVARDANGIGYVGLGYAEKRSGDVKVVSVKKDDASPPVTPSIATIADGSYPIARFLYIYTDGPPEGVTALYLKFIISDEGQRIVEEEGFIPLPDDARREQLSRLEGG